MKSQKNVLFLIAIIVALGGLLMGFDASVISGVVKFIEPEFGLTKLELGWAVASLTLTASLAMLLAGPLSDVFGRRTVLRYAAILYAISAIGSALATSFFWLVVARMIGGFGVGASLILAPMYIAEMAPPKLRGRLVSFNQLNIVVGISLAFFTNYLILQYGKSDAAWVDQLGIKEHNWRWMLGIEAVPAILYYLGLFFVPRSPRWLILKGNVQEARQIMQRLTSKDEADQALEGIMENKDHQELSQGKFKQLFNKKLRLVLTIGIVMAVLQQITGINSVFFYAPMIFEQAGLGTDASFAQAIYVGLVNLVFTVLAILFIDNLGRKPLLAIGTAGIALCMFTIAYEFNSATYQLNPDKIEQLAMPVEAESIAPLIGREFSNDVEFTKAMESILSESTWNEKKTDLLKAAIQLDPILILVAILGFVASFAISIGPVMWVLFSELFPNQIRGVAISAVGLINSAVSFMVQWVFPWELEYLGSDVTFLIYGIFAVLGFIFIIKVIPETKGKSLEEIELQLVK